MNTRVTAGFIIVDRHRVNSAKTQSCQCDVASTEEFRRFAGTFQKSPLADWRRRPGVDFQQPDSARPDFPAEASSAADARVGRASFELHFGQPAAALRWKVALHRCWRLE